MSYQPPCPFCRAGRLRIAFPPTVYSCDSCRIGTIGPPRIACLVPGCRCTRGDRKGDDPITDRMEWICAKHWAAVPRSIKRRRAKLRAIERRAAGDPDRIGRINMADAELWEKAKKIAIETAVGIR